MQESKLDDHIRLRAPSSSKASAARLSADVYAYEPPSLDWLQGTWHVTHSTLPMWKSRKNVNITYRVLSSKSAAGINQLDDVVRYQNRTAKVGSQAKTVRGVDTAVERSTGFWHWRGRGWLCIASSHWEILGHGVVGDDQANRWMVTYFSKTLFTPAGVDIYSRSGSRLPSETLEGIKGALARIDDLQIQKLVESMFDIEQE